MLNCHVRRFVFVPLLLIAFQQLGVLGNLLLHKMGGVEHEHGLLMGDGGLARLIHFHHDDDEGAGVAMSRPADDDHDAHVVMQPGNYLAGRGSSIRLPVFSPPFTPAAGQLTGLRITDGTRKHYLGSADRPMRAPPLSVPLRV